MKLANSLDLVPLSIVFVLTILFAYLCIVVGMWLHRMVNKQPESEESVGSVVGATLGLLAFMLGFTFNMTANRFDARKQFLLEEVSVIRTAYMRAGLLPESHTENIRQLLREYVALRSRAVREPGVLVEVITRSEEIHVELWTDLEDLIAAQPITISHSLYIQSLNKIVDLHGKRVTVGLQFRIPFTIWLGLYVVSGLAMIAVGYQFGQSKQRQLLFSFVLATAFSSVILLIADLDRAEEGWIKVNQQPLIELNEQLPKWS